MNSFTKVLTLLCLAWVLSSCRNESLSKIGGYYQGEWINSYGNRQQVTSRVPTLAKIDKNSTVQIEIAPTLASANAQSFWIRYADNSILLKSQIIGDQEITLKIENNNCASGRQNTLKIDFCWSEKSLSLKFGDEQINLEKNDLLLPAKQGPSVYSLDELLGRAKYLNYSVSQEAERVYQAKKQVSVAVGNLLPHFNTRDILVYVAGGPLGLVEAVGDLLPFLFPSNWFKWVESGHLANAERKSFASLRGNEMNAVENLFYLIHRDQTLFAVLQSHIEWLKKIHAAILIKEQNQALPKGSADLFNTNIVELAQDLEQLRALLSQEMAAISHSVALPVINGVTGLSPILLSDVSQEQSISAEYIYKDAQDRSYEVATLEFLIKAARNAKKERVYGFLDPTSDKNIGFGYPASIQIGKSQIVELEKRKSEMQSLIAKRSVDVAAEYNNTLAAFSLSHSGLNSSQSYLARLLRALQSGDDILDRPEFLNLIIETSRKVLRFHANQISSQYAFMMAKSKLDRLLLTGYYKNLEVGIPQ